MRLFSKNILCIVCLMVLVAANAQTTDNHLRDKILQIKEMWYIGVAGDSLYWELVAEGLEVVPAAIALIDDTTETKAAVPNWNGNYTVGDIAFSIITDMIEEIPVWEMIQGKKDYLGQNVYFEFVRDNFQNRIYLKTALSQWFAKNRDSLVWMESKDYFTNDHIDPPFVKGYYRKLQ